MNRTAADVLFFEHCRVADRLADCYNVARYTEIVLSIVILIVIALSGLRLIYTTAGTSILNMDTDFFTTFLSQALSLVVGVEFVKMLCRHSAQTVVEVLLFATARQMVVEHLEPTQTLIGIIVDQLIEMLADLMINGSSVVHIDFLSGAIGVQELRNLCEVRHFLRAYKFSIS